jgi:hypothetical protein
MYTKLLLLSLVNTAELVTNQQLPPLFTLLRKAIKKYESDEIDWHLVNGLSDLDILFLIAMVDTDLSVNFDTTVLEEAVRFVGWVHKMETEQVYH